MSIDLIAVFFMFSSCILASILFIKQGFVLRKFIIYINIVSMYMGSLKTISKEFETMKIKLSNLEKNIGVNKDKLYDTSRLVDILSRKSKDIFYDYKSFTTHIYDNNVNSFLEKGQNIKEDVVLLQILASFLEKEITSLKNNCMTFVNFIAKENSLINELHDFCKNYLKKFNNKEIKDNIYNVCKSLDTYLSIREKTYKENKKFEYDVNANKEILEKNLNMLIESSICCQRENNTSFIYKTINKAIVLINKGLENI